MAGGSPRRQGRRWAAGGGRGTGVCLLLVWMAAAAAVYWTAALPTRSGSSGLRQELLGRTDPLAASSGDAAAAAGRASGSPAVTPAAREAASQATPYLPSDPAQPQHKFLMFFSGHQVKHVSAREHAPACAKCRHQQRAPTACQPPPTLATRQGSSALADMLAQAPSVFVPGFEPLDFPGLSAQQKLAFLEATFAFPAAPAGHAAWRAALTPPLPGLRVDRQALRSFAQLAHKSVSGFKLRPYVLSDEPQAALLANHSSTGAGASASAGAAAAAAAEAAAASAGRPGGHTALTGLDPAALRALLQRHNVSVLLTQRRNVLKEALSWHRARDLGVSQFTAIRAARAAGGSVSSSSMSSRSVGGVRGSAGSAGSAGAGGSGGGAGQGLLAVDIPRLRHWLDYTARVNAELRRAAQYYGRPTLTVWYEDFLADPLREARRAAAFVGVPEAEVAALALSSKFRKAGPDAIQELVSNYGVRRVGCV